MLIPHTIKTREPMKSKPTVVSEVAFFILEFWFVFITLFGKFIQRHYCRQRLGVYEVVAIEKHQFQLTTKAK
jgi:hypothetical protein